MKDKELFIELFEEFKIRTSVLDKMIEDVGYVFDTDWACNMFYQNSSFIIKLLSIVLEVDEDWIEWFVEENNFGKRGHSCYFNEKEYKISTTEEFYNFLALQND